MPLKCKNCFEDYDGSFQACPHCGYFEGAPAEKSYQLYPGTVLKERYIVGRVLGFGGFGITYKSWDLNLKTVVAIKEYYPGKLVDRTPGTRSVSLFEANSGRKFEHGLIRFLAEARNTAKFNSNRNIINIFEYFEENNVAYIVMEFLDGVTLGAYLNTNKMDVNFCLDVTRSVCAALKEVHKYGFIHRDVSPDNIFLCRSGAVKLIDFGAARFSQNEDQQMDIIIKRGFAPPEQYEHINTQGPWTDIYALGATLYYMITGIKPEESTDRKIADTMAEPKTLNPNIPEFINHSIMKAMAVDRHLRFSSTEEFEKAINNERKVVSFAWEKKLRVRRRIVGVVAAVLIAAAVAAAFVITVIIK